jgi:hypothetical protein
MLVGDPDMEDAFTGTDLSERRVSEKVLSLRLCLGISTAGVATLAGPSTPVFTILVVLAARTLDGLSATMGLAFSAWFATSLLLCSLLRTNDPTRFPNPTFSGDD